MAAITADRPPVAFGTTRRTFVFADVVRSEWTKLRSVRSTYCTLLASVVATVGMAAVMCGVQVSRDVTVAERARFDPTALSLNGIFLAQLAIGVLGVLVITAEYSTGAIRSTFAAVPQRPTVLAAKATVFGATTLVVGMASCFGAFFVGQAILSTQGIQASIGDPGVLRAVAGSGMYLAVLGLLALGFGTLIRHSAGAISALFGVILVLPGLVAVLPSSWSNVIAKYLPSNAGQAIARTVQAATKGGGAASLSPWAGMGVFCLYAAVTLVVAGAVVHRSDA